MCSSQGRQLVGCIGLSLGEKLLGELASLELPEYSLVWQRVDFLLRIVPSEFSCHVPSSASSGASLALLCGDCVFLLLRFVS